MTTQPQDKSAKTSGSAAINTAANNTAVNSSAANSSAGTTKAGDDGRGTTAIADNVVAKIAGIAVRDIPGVYALGGGAARALGSLRDAVGQKDHTQGISVEVGQTQVAVDITVVVEYPHPLKEVAGQVRDAIYSAVEDLVGMEVTEVNVTVTDIHVPGDDSDDDESNAAKNGARNSTQATATEPRVS